MKPAKAATIFILPRIVLLYFFIASVSLQTKAQCGPGLQNTSYNVVLNGNGNNTWGFVFPQFDPSVGTLVAVDIRLAISMGYNFTLENSAGATVDYTLVLERDDYLQSTALSASIYNSVVRDFGPYELGPTDGITSSGGDFTSQGPITFLNKYSINDSVTNAVAGFLGTSNVSFNYSPITFAYANGGPDYSLAGSGNDTASITVTYYYCTANILASDITSFSVTKESDALAKINWATENEIAGRTYEIEESSDGKNFSDVASMQSVINGSGTSNYAYEYPVAAGTTGKLYFRLKEINADEYTKYSEIRSIEIDNKNEIYLYPNPADNFINIVFNRPAPDGWQVDIFAADGRLVQRNYFLNSGTAHIDFLQRFAKGAYFMRAIDRQTQKMYVQSFIVR